MDNCVFLKNGFELIHENNGCNEQRFVPYQAISLIDEVKIKICKENYDYLSRTFYGDYVAKRCSFFIRLNNQQNLEIFFQEDIKKFPISSNKSFIFKKNISKEAQNWLNDKGNMKEPFIHISNFRDKLVEKFNNWKKGENNENKSCSEKMV